MAQFTAQGRLKVPFNGVEAKDSLQYKPLGNVFGGGLRSNQVHKRRIGFLGASTGVYSSFSNKSGKFDVKVGPTVSDEGIHEEEDDYDCEFDVDDFSCFRGLVLDISYRPINVVCWKRAICLEFTEKADVLEYYDQTVNSPSGSFCIPAVLRVCNLQTIYHPLDLNSSFHFQVPHLLQVVKRRRIKHTLSRKNILYRDNYTCQYCSSREKLTIDHVLPVARGGEWKWENLVAACARCNSKKGQKTLEEAKMELLKVPKAPKDYDILAIPLTEAAIRMLRMRNGTPEEWRQYLSPSSEP
ncbi:hypothetical protein SLEP1_g19176 [Rubroshorea leprosula]|nr:hypothetical protein SLEP1_g19176 [Rubroshorea leprosula]